MTEGGARSSFRTVAILALIPVAGLALFYLWNWIEGGESPRETFEEARAKSPAAQTTSAATLTPALPVVKRRAIAPKKRGRGGQIVLIIDDLGFDGQPLQRVMALDPNVNCSILPNGTNTAAVARTLHARGFEILCHLPMEPKGNETPGRNAILTSMSDDEIARVTRENIEAVPYARGMNNHMGSRATTDRRVMASVIDALPEGMYFIDSRTTGGSVAVDVARERNVPTAARHVFLDDVASERAVRAQLESLAGAAEKHGVAIGIGHPYPVTLRVLASELPALRARGFRLVRASAAVR